MRKVATCFSNFEMVTVSSPTKGPIHQSREKWLIESIRVLEKWRCTNRTSASLPNWDSYDIRVKRNVYIGKGSKDSMDTRILISLRIGNLVIFKKTLKSNF